MVEIWSRSTRKLRVNETFELHCVAISMFRFKCVGIAEVEVWGLECGVWVVGFGVWGLGFGVKGFGFRFLREPQ